ncbi:PilZ domain-containing protein [Rhizobium sullae]|uniref:PilZ domain-containing protein n=1 Tax=Rhizobium sullae TaxID=50338 RepID=UPI000B354C92|nr:PilZ domain-containing protein [Rhizobium sullae]
MTAVAVPKRREREFPRFKLPLAALIDGKRIEVCDWSVTGLGLAAVALTQAPGDYLAVTLLLETEGSCLELALNTRIVWVDADERRAGLQILDPAETTAPLAHFADLYLAGRVVQSGSKVYVLGHQMAEKEDAKAAVVGVTASSTGNGLAGRIFGLLIFVVIGLAAFSFLSSIVYKRLFTFEAVSASIAAETVTVYQPRDGVVEFAALPQKVKQGDRLATIVLDAPAADGKSIVEVLSACDCYVLSVDHPGSTYGRAGGRMLSLVRQDAPLYVSVRVPFRRLANIAEKPQISLSYLDGVKAKKVEIVSIPKVTEYTTTQLEIQVQPGRSLDPSMVGQPVLATFDTAPWH